MRAGLALFGLELRRMAARRWTYAVRAANTLCYGSCAWTLRWWTLSRADRWLGRA